MTPAKRKPDADLMQKADDARNASLSDGHGVTWMTWVDDLRRDGKGGDGGTFHAWEVYEQRAAILESLAYDGVEVEATWWESAQVGYVRPFARKTAP